jgi:hypothetical protein
MERHVARLADRSKNGLKVTNNDSIHLGYDNA